jgi:hypothetical protein
LSNEVVHRLFKLALEIGKREQSSGYAGIGGVLGPYSWSFLEHLNELPEEGKAELLHALIKRRFAKEGISSPESSISEAEQLEINHWLRHNNSLHGTRTVGFFAWSEREELFLNDKPLIKLASKQNIRRSVTDALKRSTVQIQMKVDSTAEVRWQSTLRNRFTVDGWMDFGGAEQATSFFVVHDGKRPLHVPTSLLGILGIGQDTWEFIKDGQENICSSTSIDFFAEVCTAVAEIKL